jgi:hypothetical protein
MPALACFRILRLHLRFDEAHPGFPEARNLLVIPSTGKFDRH